MYPRMCTPLSACLRQCDLNQALLVYCVFVFKECMSGFFGKILSPTTKEVAKKEYGGEVVEMNTNKVEEE